MCDNFKENDIEETEQKLNVAIAENRITEVELRQENYRKEVDEKFNKIFKFFGIQNMSW